MPAVQLVLFYLLSIVFAIQLIFGLLYSYRANRSVAPDSNRIDCISIIIPVCNEEKRIVPLIWALNNQREGQARIEVIFVDDYSTDATVKILNETVKVPFRIISNQGKKGKKFALHQGIQVAAFDFILTLDADVYFDSYFFINVLDCPPADLIILPVEMNGESLFQVLNAIEFVWLQKLTFGAKQPILCNGANLLFRKSSYFSAYELRNDFDLASGDDVFLLDAMLGQGKLITRLSSPTLAIQTPAPETWEALLNQRKRWGGKTSRLKNIKVSGFAIFLVTVEISFLITLILGFFNPIFFALIALKFLTEFALVYSSNLSRGSNFMAATIVHQVWYPVYLAVLLMRRKKDNKW